MLHCSVCEQGYPQITNPERRAPPAPNWKSCRLYSAGKLRLLEDGYVDIEFFVVTRYSAQDAVGFLLCLLTHIRHMCKRDMIHKCFHATINARHLVLC
jgi:hypothetical protein